jgi:retron-type reverse transcriptase
MAAVLVLEPIFEADLQPEQYAYRPDRSALDAVQHVHKLINTGHGQIVDADLSSYFDRRRPWRKVVIITRGC